MVVGYKSRIVIIIRGRKLCLLVINLRFWAIILGRKLQLWVINLRLWAIIFGCKLRGLQIRAVFIILGCYLWLRVLIWMRVLTMWSGL